MKKHLFLKSLLVALGLLIMSINTAWGQSFGAENQRQAQMQSQMMMSSGSLYSGTVYQPFSNTTPSEASNPARIGGPRREKIDTGDEGEGGEGGEGWLDKPDYGGTDLSPIGEPWIMALFALGFMGIIFIRKRKLNQKSEMKNTNKFIATLALLFTLGVGQMWAYKINGNLRLYYYNTNGWGTVGFNVWGGTWSHKEDLHQLGNTKIWYIDSPTNGWDNITAWQFYNTSNDSQNSGNIDGNNITSNTVFIPKSGGGHYWFTSYAYVEPAGGATIYFDNTDFSFDASSIYLRAGFNENDNGSNKGANEAMIMNHVDGTESLYKVTLPNAYPYHLYTISNNDGWQNLNTIYNIGAEENHHVTKQIPHVSTNVTGDYTIISTLSGGNRSYAGGDGCNYYYYETIGGHTRNVSITAPTGGTITVAYTNESNTSDNFTSGDRDLAHTCIITVTATPSTGYVLSSLTRNGGAYEEGSEYTIREDNTFAATFAPKQSAITFDYQTSAAGYNDGANGITNEDLKGTYDAEMTALTGSMPTAKNGYKFQGFYDAAGGSGTKYYNADGTSAHVWDKDTESGTTLYAYYQPAEMSLALAALTIGTGEGDSATVSITPAVGSPAFNQVGTIMFCYDVKIKNGASMDPQPVGRQFTEGGVLKYRFASPRYSGNYTLNIKLRAGSDCSGAQIDSKDIDFIVSGDHTVTIRHKCGDVEIHEPTTVTIHPGETADVTAFTDEQVFGYTFDEWSVVTATSGVTIETGDEDNETITISTIFDGTITAKYDKRNLIYFKNTLGWSDVWIHFLPGAYWSTTEGAGNYKKTDRNKHMTRIGETDVWYYDYSANSITPNGFEVFTDREFTGSGDGYDHFHGTSSSDPALVSFPIVYDNTDDDDTRYGFHAGTPMFVPVDQTPYQTKVNSDANKIANNYNRGYWREYEPVTGKTGYTLKVYDRCEATDRKELQSKAMTDGSGDAIFEATVDLEAGKTYGIKFLRGSDWYYTNTDDWKGVSPKATVFPTDESSVACYQLASEYAAIQLTTTVSGNYTFKIYCSASEGKLKMSVKYPATTSDYRIVYHDDATWTPENGAHAAGWMHPSHVITKRDGGEDIVSFFVKADASPKFKFQKITGLNPVAWSDVETGEGDHFINVPDSIIAKGTGVYNFHLKQEGSSISVVKIEPYTGNYYIRTDNAGSTKWSDFRASDHLMTYSEYADKKGNFTHYFMKFVEVSNRKNVKFCIANDYSMCISDTLTRQSSDYSASFSHVDANGDIDADANIRYMWNINTNALSRKYLARAQSDGSYFLVLKGESSKIADKDGRALSISNGNNKGVGNDEIQFSDDQDWIYEAQVQATPGGRIKLYARYDGEDQYFYGDNDASFTDTHGEELIGGSGAAEVIRAIYDFKTNRLMAAWVPSGTISSNKTIEADIMLVREQQNGGGQINLTNSAILTTSTNKQIYGVMRFNRWDLNNLSRTNTGTNENPIHAALDPGDQKSAYERFNYFISFPFDVKVGEIFGFGRIGRHYRIYFYDGIGRAQEGFFAERKSNWKMIDDTDSILHAYQGYLLQLNSVRMATTQEDVWPQANQDQVELYFPAMRAISSITIANETIPALALDGPYKCNKDLSSLHGGNQDANRTNKDSYWRCIGTPSFANYDADFEEWTDFDYEVDDKAMPYLYEWETTTNKLVPVTSTNFRFLSMHAYLIQNPNQIIWANASKPTYSAIVARTRDAETEHEWKLTLTDNNEGLLDQTFVRMSDNDAVTANFDFGQDLIKEWNEDANIYTLIGSEQVAANSMPFSDQTTIVPMGVKIASDGDYTISMPEGTNGVGVVLIDNIAGTRTNLALTDYTVYLTAGTHDERFILEISPMAQTPTDIESVAGNEGRNNGARKVMVDGILYIVKDGKVFDARGTLCK